MLTLSYHPAPTATNSPLNQPPGSGGLQLDMQMDYALGSNCNRSPGPTPPSVRVNGGPHVLGRTVAESISCSGTSSCSIDLKLKTLEQ